MFILGSLGDDSRGGFVGDRVSPGSPDPGNVGLLALFEELSLCGKEGWQSTAEMGKKAEQEGSSVRMET